MNINQKESLKFCLRGKKFKLSMQLALSRLCVMMFLLYCLSVFYLLIFDVSLIADIGLYENRYVAALICFSAVLIGFVLLLLSVWQCHKSKLSIYASVDTMDIPKFRLNYVLKLMMLKSIAYAIKLGYIFIGLIPSACMTFVCLRLLRSGVSVAVLVVLSASDIVLLINGIISSVILIKKLHLCDYCLSENPTRSIRQIINESYYLTDGKCTELAKNTLYYFVYSLSGLIIPYFSVREIASQFIIATDKIIPHAQRKAHTEKSIVFYIGDKVRIG